MFSYKQKNQEAEGRVLTPNDFWWFVLVSAGFAGPGWALGAVQWLCSARRGAQEGSGTQHGKPVSQVCTSLFRWWSGCFRHTSDSTDSWSALLVLGTANSGPVRCICMNLKCKTLVPQDTVNKTMNSHSSTNNVAEISLGKKRKSVVLSGPCSDSLG